jgi:hypothetical protein
LEQGLVALYNILPVPLKALTKPNQQWISIYLNLDLNHILLTEKLVFYEEGKKTVKKVAGTLERRQLLRI